MRRADDYAWGEWVPYDPEAFGWVRKAQGARLYEFARVKGPVPSPFRSMPPRYVGETGYVDLDEIGSIPEGRELCDLAVRRLGLIPDRDNDDKVALELFENEFDPALGLENDFWQASAHRWDACWRLDEGVLGGGHEDLYPDDDREIALTGLTVVCPLSVPHHQATLVVDGEPRQMWCECILTPDGGIEFQGREGTLSRSYLEWRERSTGEVTALMRKAVWERYSYDKTTFIKTLPKVVQDELGYGLAKAYLRLELDGDWTLDTPPAKYARQALGGRVCDLEDAFASLTDETVYEALGRVGMIQSWDAPGWAPRSQPETPGEARAMAREAVGTTRQKAGADGRKTVVGPRR